jgi:hypothetical protein
MATATKNKPVTEQSTALAMVETGGYLALSPDSAAGIMAAQESLAGVGETFGVGDLIKIPTPTASPNAAVQKWIVPDGVGGETMQADVTGILCFICKRGVLWPSYEVTKGGQPVLVSDDLVTARQIGPIPPDMVDTLNKFKIGEGVYQWDKLPYNEFGSGKDGRGKRCKEQRLLFLLREGDVYPTLVTAQPGSLKSLRQFIMRLPQAAKVPYWQCVISLSLEKAPNSAGQDYCRIVPKLVGTLTAEQGAVIKSKFTDVLAKIASRVDVEGTTETEAR